MNIIYKVTDTLNNLSYIGSKMNYVEGSSYLGSPSCREGHPLQIKCVYPKRSMKKTNLT